jgi:peptidoglycan/LPS O-acetylase OafA/YrhL
LPIKATVPAAAPKPLSAVEWLVRSHRTNPEGEPEVMSGEIETNHAAGARHYPILDALRFALAFWVVLDHFGLPPMFAGADESHLIVRSLSHGYRSVASGQAAVMCFFVISGFCIHLPFRKGKKLSVGRFYARRYIRILIPVMAGVLIFRLAGNHRPLLGTGSVWWNSVLWSLLCEEIYYAVYPAMLWFLRKFGWTWLLVPAFASSITLALSRTHSRGWEEFGPLQTAAILYPVWILGCLLAEQSESLAPAILASEIWKWRFVVWACSGICEMMNFKAGIYFPQTMMWFGVVAYFWLRRELAFDLNRRGVSDLTRLLMAGGGWSYSLYLMHLPVMTIFDRLKIPNFGPLMNWCISIFFVLVCSYVFYLVIERPAHQLARKVGTFEFKTTPFQEPRYPAQPLSPT